MFSTWDAQRSFLVQIAERDEARREIAAGIATQPAPAARLCASGARALHLVQHRPRVKPLNRLGQEVERRKADDLRPFSTARRAARKSTPLVRSLNALFDRVGRLIENERRFTADAAHELRTPLAALKTQAQVAKAPADDGARQHALDGVIDGCDRATRLVDQLLTLARLEPDAARPAGQCELVGLAREVIAELAPFALAKDVDIELRRSEPVSVEGHRELFPCSCVTSSTMPCAIALTERA